MVEINFDSLPGDIKNMIFSKNRKWVKSEILTTKYFYTNDVVEEINNINIYINEMSCVDILHRIKYDLYEKRLPFCMSCECVDGCDNNYCYYALTHSEGTPTNYRRQRFIKIYGADMVNFWLNNKIPHNYKIKYKLP